MAEEPDELDVRFSMLHFTRQTYFLGICAAVVNFGVMAIPFLLHPWYVAIWLCIPNLVAACIVLFVAMPRLREAQEKLKGNRPPV